MRGWMGSARKANRGGSTADARAHVQDPAPRRGVVREFAVAVPAFADAQATVAVDGGRLGGTRVDRPPVSVQPASRETSLVFSATAGCGHGAHVIRGGAAAAVVAAPVFVTAVAGSARAGRATSTTATSTTATSTTATSTVLAVVDAVALLVEVCDVFAVVVAVDKHRVPDLLVGTGTIEKIAPVRYERHRSGRHRGDPGLQHRSTGSASASSGSHKAVRLVRTPPTAAGTVGVPCTRPRASASTRALPRRPQPNQSNARATPGASTTRGPPNPHRSVPFCFHAEVPDTAASTHQMLCSVPHRTFEVGNSGVDDPHRAVQMERRHYPVPATLKVDRGLRAAATAIIT